MGSGAGPALSCRAGGAPGARRGGARRGQEGRGGARRGEEGRGEAPGPAKEEIPGLARAWDQLSAVEAAGTPASAMPSWLPRFAYSLRWCPYEDIHYPAALQSPKESPRTTRLP